MSLENNPLQLPSYEDFNQSIQALNISGSNLHGMMCGYLCAGADLQGETYLRTLANRKDESTKQAYISIFSVYSISQELISGFHFEFNLLLPDEEAPLMDRACAFSEWCEGFIQGMELAGISPEQFYEEEAIDAFKHISEFAKLDSDALDINEEDEEALMEVSEYTRMAVLRLHADLIANTKEQDPFEHTH